MTSVVTHRAARALVLGSVCGLLAHLGACSDEPGGGPPAELDSGVDGAASRADACSVGCETDASETTDSAAHADASGDDASDTDASFDATADADADADASVGTTADADADASPDAATEAGNDSGADAADASGPTQTVGGTVSGLLAGTLVLQNEGGDDLAITKNGLFQFATGVVRGGPYDVKVKTQPPGQSCTVTAGQGNVPTSDVTSVVIKCDDTLSCPVGSNSGKQTVCGRIYDLADDSAVEADALCTPCAAATATGPCSLKLTAFDVVSFAQNPGTASPLAATESYIDTCGRFRLADLGLGASGSTMLLIDDAAGFGTTGNTVTVAIPVPNAAGGATKNVEAWIASPTLTQGWATSGGPALSSGIFAAIFRAHVAPETDRRANQVGVAMTVSGMSVPAQDHYFSAASLSRTTVDAAATATSVNGTALLTGASLATGTAYSGTGIPDPTNCKWETKGAGALPNVLWLQVFRPTNQLSKTCTL